ncbi:hypothetical protein V8G54_028015 [Vigna mungo]|uniref:GRF-type domain-containing protein n=1 Tax=Vigna mungo TaxID=3915 RepID=A0AAQ3MSL3_VIGMU
MEALITSLVMEVLLRGEGRQETGRSGPKKPDCMAEQRRSIEGNINYRHVRVFFYRSPPFRTVEKSFDVHIGRSGAQEEVVFRGAVFFGECGWGKESGGGKLLGWSLSSQRLEFVFSKVTVVSHEGQLVRESPKAVDHLHGYHLNCVVVATTVKNKGRWFFRCRNWASNSSCNYFEWHDEGVSEIEGSIERKGEKEIRRREESWESDVVVADLWSNSDSRMGRLVVGQCSQMSIGGWTNVQTRSWTDQ